MSFSAPLSAPPSPLISAPLSPLISAPLSPLISAPLSPPQLPPAPTPEEQAEEKERRDRRNVNITLYTACLLLVAAASLFIGAALPVTARVAGLAVVVGLFYGAGLVVHATSRTLRPAATAFTGTGLALVPVAGVALDVLVLHDPTLSWLLTSAVGTAMMVIAAVRLDSRIVAYLTVPFLLSTVMASGAAVQQGLVWALIASIGLAVLMAWISVEGPARNRWLPAAFRTAFAQTHQWIVPGMVVLGLVVGVWIDPVQMFLLLLSACAYYATVAVIGPERYRLAATYAVRCGVLVALVPWALMLGWSADLMLTSMVVYLCVQIPLVWRGAGAQGYLPVGAAAMVDHAGCWLVAVALAASSQLAALAGTVLGTEGLLRFTPGIGVAAAVVVVTTAAFSLLFLHTNRLGEVGAPGTANLLWQVTTPVALTPLLIHPLTRTEGNAGAGDGRGWNLEIILLVIMAVEAIALVLLRRRGQPRRIDARLIPHVIAASGVALVYLAASRWAYPDGGTALTLTALAAVLWATVTALHQGPLTVRGDLTTDGEGWAATERPTGSEEPAGTAEPAGGAEPAGREKPVGTAESAGREKPVGTAEPVDATLPVVVWSGASLLAVLLLLTPSLSQGGVLLGWYVLAGITAAVALRWLGTGARWNGASGRRGDHSQDQSHDHSTDHSHDHSHDDSHDDSPDHPHDALGDRLLICRTLVLIVGGLTLLTATLRFADAAEAARTSVITSTTSDSSTGVWSWHVVIGLVLLTCWLVTVAVVTRGRLPQATRTVVLLAGQASSAVLVSTVVDRLGGNDSAARAAAVVALVVGLALRSRFARRLPGSDQSGGSAGFLTAPAMSWLVTGAVIVLGFVELAAGEGDRAALMVMALALMGAGLVLRVSAGGHWAVLAGVIGLVVVASAWFDLTGGWLPAALFPTSAAAALILLLTLSVAAWEIAVSTGRLVPRAGSEPGSVSSVPSVPSLAWLPWLYDLALFRAVAAATGWAVALVLGLTGEVDRGPHFGALGMTMAVGALVLYVFARARGMVALLAGTVIAVPVSWWLLSPWWTERGWWYPEEAWTAVLIGVLSAAGLGLWALVDARQNQRSLVTVEAVRSTEASVALDSGIRQRPAILWQGGLAVMLVLALGTVVALEPRAGLPEDAVVWTALAAVVAGIWLTIDAWGRTLLWAAALDGQTQWVLFGRDAAVLLTFAAASRAWWQTALPDDPGRAGWWNVQLLVLVLVGLGFRHVLRDRSLPGQETGGRRPMAHFGAASGVFTIAGLYVLANGSAQMQLTVLVGFALLVMLGLTRREQLLTWWGAAGVAMSVLWYLRGYTYVYLALLGLVLIVLAVRQLRRHQARQPAGGSEQVRPSAAGPDLAPDLAPDVDVDRDQAEGTRGR
ncbi:hypothetical protein LG284_16005 [Citricoccus nitrophenolicus]